jgi:hypothetical protein
VTSVAALDVGLPKSLYPQSVGAFMHEPTDRVQWAERSRIRVMYDLAESADRDLVRLEVGEPDFDTPDHVAAEAARDGATHYTPNAGLPECRRPGLGAAGPPTARTESGFGRTGRRWNRGSKACSTRSNVTRRP